LAEASDESGVVDDGNFWQFEWLLLNNNNKFVERHSAEASEALAVQVS